ncbi:MAG: hypothetical protein IPG32_04930 [Saprospirales bacterium]|nr:hypothetical protein [Saprospirales bacterium]
MHREGWPGIRLPAFRAANRGCRQCTGPGFTGQPSTRRRPIYYQSRFYPGPFPQPDSWIRARGPQTLNRYTYVGNNPLTFVDPTGHWFGVDDLIAAGVGFAVGFTVALIASDFDWKVALAAGLSNAVTFWFAYSTFGVGGAVFIGSMQLAATVSNNVFAGSKGGSIGDAIQLVTTFGASPMTSTVGLVVGVSYILFTTPGPRISITSMGAVVQRGAGPRL